MSHFSNRGQLGQQILGKIARTNDASEQKFTCQDDLLNRRRDNSRSFPWAPGWQTNLNTRTQPNSYPNYKHLNNHLSRILDKSKYWIWIDSSSSSHLHSGTAMPVHGKTVVTRWSVKPKSQQRSTDFPHFSGFPTAICSINHVNVFFPHSPVQIKFLTQDRQFSLSRLTMLGGAISCWPAVCIDLANALVMNYQCSSILSNTQSIEQRNDYTTRNTSKITRLCKTSHIVVFLFKFETCYYACAVLFKLQINLQNSDIDHLALQTVTCSTLNIQFWPLGRSWLHYLTTNCNLSRVLKEFNSID